MFGNWIQQTTTTTGTGNLTLVSVTGYPAFSTQMASGQRFAYTILDDASGDPIESGIGYLSSGALVRERIESTMVSGTFDNTAPSAVSLASGTKRVICSPTAAVVSAPAAGAYLPSGGVRGYGDGNQVFGSGGGFTLWANQAITKPFSALASQELDAVVCRITTAGSGGALIRGAVYSVGADGLPGVKLVESGAVAGDTTGIKELTFTAFRPPPRFFVGVIASANITFYATQSSVNGMALGFNNVMEPIGFLLKNGSGTTFPADWSSPSNGVAFAWAPILAVRCVL